MLIVTNLYVEGSDYGIFDSNGNLINLINCTPDNLTQDVIGAGNTAQEATDEIRSQWSSRHLTE